MAEIIRAQLVRGPANQILLDVEVSFSDLEARLGTKCVVRGFLWDRDAELDLAVLEPNYSTVATRQAAPAGPSRSRRDDLLGTFVKENVDARRQRQTFALDLQPGAREDWTAAYADERDPGLDFVAQVVVVPETSHAVTWTEAAVLERGRHARFRVEADCRYMTPLEAQDCRSDPAYPHYCEEHPCIAGMSYTITNTGTEKIDRAVVDQVGELPSSLLRDHEFLDIGPGETRTGDLVRYEADDLGHYGPCPGATSQWYLSVEYQGWEPVLYTEILTCSGPLLSIKHLPPAP